MNTVEGALLLVVVILPGFVASLFTRDHDIEPRRRSATDAIAFLLHFAVYVHALAITAFVLIDLRQNLHLVDIIEGPRQYFLEQPVRGVWVYGGYLFIIMLVSPLVGTYNLPRFLPGLLVRSLRRLKLAPRPSLSEEPIWYSAFHQMRGEAGKEAVRLRVRMKSGDIYVGPLIKYPIVGDEIKDKDFLIDQVSYYPQGEVSEVRQLARSPGLGGVLLNTHEVDSLEFAYFDSTSE